MSYTTKKLGTSGEDVAAEYLMHTCGYGILYRNFRSYSGEIDIIAKDRDIIVFIEVKTPKGRPTKEQKHFLEQMRDAGAVAGICRSAEEAVGLVKEEKDAVK